MSEVHSVVVSVYNEADGIDEFHRRCVEALSTLPAFEIIYVDDGSRDASGATLARIAATDPRVKIITLGRNFGHQIAISAGLDMSSGDTVTVIDADLQDPPELIPTLIERWREGADVVFAVRTHRAGETAFKKATASLYYRILRALGDVDIPLDAGDFRLVSRRAAECLKAMREQSRYTPGMVAWMGLERAYVEYERDGRFAGATKHSLRTLTRLAVDGVVSVSLKPLRFATVLGSAVTGASLVYAAVLLAEKLQGIHIEGWHVLLAAGLFLGGAQLIALGIIGEYVGRIFDEVRNRPLYVVQSTTNFAPADEEHFSASVTPR